MKKLTGRTRSAQGSLTISSAALGKGGEGSVYKVEQHSIGGLPAASELVAKIYHDPKTGNRGRKVAAMITAPPSSEALAWPLALIADESGSLAM